MSRSLTVLAADEGFPGVPDCAEYSLCQTLHDWFGLDWLAENARVLVATPARIVLVVLAAVVLAAVVRALAHRAIRTPIPLLAGATGVATGIR
jgi:moderate conductance mechanosensitive channel